MYDQQKSSKRNFWRSTFFLLLITILLAMTACGGSGPASNSSGSTSSGSGGSEGGGSGQDGAEEVVKIGGLMSFSGNFASLGEGMREGLDLYLEMNDYKIGNRKVEIIYEDDENNPQVALRKYRKLVDSDQVDMLVGIASSTILYALRDQVDKDGIPLIVAIEVYKYA